MTFARLRTIILLLLLTLIAACATVKPPVEKETNASFINRQRSLAINHQNNGELATALTHWRLILLLDPGHEEANIRDKSLEKLLQKKAEKYYAAGLKARKSGSAKRARANFMATLAAVPDHAEARQQLSLIQSNKMAQSQLRKSSDEKLAALATMPFQPGQSARNVSDLQQMFDDGQYGAVITQSKAVRNRKNNNVLDNLLALAHVQQARHLIGKDELSEAGNHYTEAKDLSSEVTDTIELIIQVSKRLANEYYARGRSLLSTNINQGIDYLKTSLEYYPDDRRVVALLRRSQLMRDKLAKISGKK